MGRGLRGRPGRRRGVAALALFAPASAWRIRVRARTRSGGGEQFPVDQQRDVGGRATGRSCRHECGGEGGPVTATAAKAAAAGVTIADDPTLAQVAAEFDYSPNMTPIGYSANVIPYLPSPYNSDLAFQGKYAYQGTNDGFVVIDIKDPAEPEAGPPQHELHDRRRATSSSTGTSSCARGTPRPAPPAPRRSPAAARSSARASRASTSSTSPTRRTRSWSTSATIPPTASRACASPRRTSRARAAARTPPPPSRTPARDALYIYNGGSSGTCTWMDVLKIKISDPTPGLLRQAGAGRAPVPRQHGLPQRRRQPRDLRGRQRHHGVQVRRHDRPDAAGRHREPDPAVVEAAGRRHRPLRPRSATTARRSSSAMSRAAASRRSARPPARP